MNDDPDTLDATLDVLADRTRRRLLNRLQEADQLTIDRIAAELVEGGETRTNDRGTASERERIEVSLRHVHLPKMADAGVIDWSPETGRIEANGNTEAAYELLAVGSRTARADYQKVSEQS